MREKEIEKQSEIIQKYFNKINFIKANELELRREAYTNDPISLFSGFRTSLDSIVSIEQNRIQRYREYEQMTYVTELNSGLELYADDSTLYNEDDNVITTRGDNQDVVNTLEDLWFNTLDMNSNLWHIVYNTCKYGDAFYEVIPDSFENPKRIKYIKYIPPKLIYRVEEDGNLIHFVVKNDVHSSFRSDNYEEETILQPWQVVHFKLDDKDFEPYGKSILEHGRLAYKQMKLIEDAILIYRISRAPERRIFYIPVGNLPYEEAMARVEDFKQKYRKTPWIDPSTGEINYRANPLSINDDFFIPRRADGSGVTIDNLPGGQQLGEIDDMKYFKEKVLRTMRVPLSYITGEMTGDVAKTSLSAMDVRFAKNIERIQRFIIKGLEKLAIIELIFRKFTIDDLYSFKIKLTKPSKIYELQDLEVLSQKINIINSALTLKDDVGRLYLPKDWLYKKVNKFNDDEISTIKLMQQIEMSQDIEDAKKIELAKSQEGPPTPELGGGEIPAGVGALEQPGLETTPAETETPGGEGEIEKAAQKAGEAELEVASKILKIAGKEFLLENEDDIREVINFVKTYKENNKITKDNSKNKILSSKKLYENSFNSLFIKGEFRGLIHKKKRDIIKD